MNRYIHSQEHLSRAERIIPGGSQTFSKGKRVYPYGVSPYFLTRGKGAHVWDVDGNEYIDFNNGLAAITLGYNDADVTQAVEEQMKSGVTFTLSHPIEIDVAEMLVDLIPCAEMVRFGKNGSDVTAAAIRLARAYTSRDHVAACGYHGWHDWIASATVNRGVPQSTRELTHTFAYNDIEALRRLFAQYPQQIAAVILEPMNKIEPSAGYLASVKEVTQENGALLIFDEVMTGFRFALGGAQEYFSVVPDLATFGKGLANGYPISAIVGRSEVMKMMDEIFYSLTYGGETLSLAAALATLRKLTTEPVIETMMQSGSRLKTGLQRRVEQYGLEDIAIVSGHPTATWIQFRDVAGYTDWQIQALFLQEVLSRGILTFGKHNISYAHSNADVDQLLAVYDEVLPILRDAVGTHSLEKSLRCEPINPVLRIR